MKTQIENSLKLYHTDENLTLVDEFNSLIIETKRAKSFDNLKKSMASTKYFYIYKGGSHIAVHQLIDGKVDEFRILFITK